MRMKECIAVVFVAAFVAASAAGAAYAYSAAYSDGVQQKEVSVEYVMSSDDGKGLLLSSAEAGTVYLELVLSLGSGAEAGAVTLTLTNKTTSGASIVRTVYAVASGDSCMLSAHNLPVEVVKGVNDISISVVQGGSGIGHTVTYARVLVSYQGASS